MTYCGRNPGETVPIKLHNLRALLHWAAIGISQSHGGAYGEDAEAIVKFQASRIQFQLAIEPKFKEARDDTDKAIPDTKEADPPGR